MTRTSRAALAAAVLQVAGAADARAAAIREVHIGPIPAPLGYSAIVRASGGPFGEQTLDVDLSRGPEDDTYLLGAGLTVDLRGGRIHGPLGPYGTIDLALRPTGPERRLRNPRGCFGPRRRIQNAIATGTIEFAPERTSFGQIRTTASFPARFSTDPAFFCRALPRGPRTDVDLDASADRHDLVSSLDLLRTARGLFATVNADTGEKSTTPVQVRRTLTVRLPRSAARLSRDRRTLVLRPHTARLTGYARFRAKRRGKGVIHGRMTGRIAARFDSIGAFDPFAAGPLDAFLQVDR